MAAPHGGCITGADVQAVDHVPTALFFAILCAVTGICRKEFARNYMIRWVQMTYVQTDARTTWRADALGVLQQWLGASQEQWMVKFGGLAVNSRYVKQKVRANASTCLEAGGKALAMCAAS